MASLQCKAMEKDLYLQMCANFAVDEVIGAVSGPVRTLRQVAQTQDGGSTVATQSMASSGGIRSSGCSRVTAVNSCAEDHSGGFG